MTRRRTRLSPRFAIGAAAPNGEGYDVPADLGTEPRTPPKVSELPQAEQTPRASWPRAVVALLLPALIALGLSRRQR